MRLFVLVLLAAAVVAQETTTEIPEMTTMMPETEKDDDAFKSTTTVPEPVPKEIKIDEPTMIMPTQVTIVEDPMNRAARMFFGGLFQFPFGSRCPVPNPVCPINCSTDPAVVHGFCCGCRQSLFGFDYPPPITCPAFLSCPPPEPLCSDYRFVMDCCCGAGIAF